MLQSNASKKVQAVKDNLGPCLLGQIKKLKTPISRRPYLASLSERKVKVARKSVEEAIGWNINSREWTNIKIHAKYPGSFNPVEPPDIHRFRISRDVLLKLLRVVFASMCAVGFHGNVATRICAVISAIVFN